MTTDFLRECGAEWDRMSAFRRQELLIEARAPVTKKGALSAEWRRVAAARWGQFSRDLQFEIARVIRVQQQATAERQRVTRARFEDAVVSVPVDIREAMGAYLASLWDQPIRPKDSVESIIYEAVTGECGGCLLPHNKRWRKVFERFTGFKLPRTVKGTREALAAGAPFSFRCPETN